MAIGREPLKPQPNNGLGAIFNKQNTEAKRLGQIQGISPISVKTNAAGTFISWAGTQSDPTKWVEIIDSNEQEPSNKYSWVALKVDPSGSISHDSTLGSGNYSAESGYAIEITGCKYVLWGTRCRLYKEGSNYSFEYRPEVVAATTTDKIGPEGQGVVTVPVTVLGEYRTQDIEVNNPWSLPTEKARAVAIAYGQGKWGIIAEDCPPPEDEEAEENK